MVKIRLTRTGKTHQPHYRLIAIQARTKRDGMALEQLGYYNPRTKPSTIELKKDRIEHWLKAGAQPSETVKSLLIKEKIMAAPTVKKTFNGKPGKKAQAIAAEKAAAAESKE